MKTFILNKRDGEITNKVIVAKNINELEDGRYQVKIENTKKRSLQQNAWLHAVLPEIQEALYGSGWREVKTTADAKMVVKGLFAKTIQRNDLTGEEIAIIKDTHEMTKEEMAKFAEEIIDWAAQYLQLQIAPPSSQVGLYDTYIVAEYDQSVKATIVK